MPFSISINFVAYIKAPSTGHIHNILGYMNLTTGNKEQAKKHFEKYLAEYPQGYNPYDSMADFYMQSGDLENAKSYYTQVLEKFPASTNAMNKQEEIEGMMSDAGRLIVLDIEHVDPQFTKEYWQWGKEYKAIAEKTGYNDFWVSASNGSYQYVRLHRHVRLRG